MDSSSTNLTGPQLRVLKEALEVKDIPLYDKRSLMHYSTTISSDLHSVLRELKKHRAQRAAHQLKKIVDMYDAWAGANSLSPQDIGQWHREVKKADQETEARYWASRNE